MGLESDQGRPTEQYDPDAQFGRMFLVGCGVLVVIFAIGTVVIGYLWLH